MKYGKNSDAVGEVVELAKSGPLLLPFAQKTHNVVTCEDLSEAKRHAWEDTYGADGLTWTDLREREMSRVKSRSYESEEFRPARSNLSTLIDTLTAYVRRRLPEDYSDILDDVIGDLYCCCVFRAVHGAAPCFFEQVFQAYSSGGWPCGWSGEYPTGEIIVYFPCRRVEGRWHGPESET